MCELCTFSQIQSQLCLFTGACLQGLVNNALTWQSSCVITNNAQKQQKLFVLGYNLEGQDVIKYTRKHHATDVTNYITCKSGFVLHNKQKS